MKYLTVPSFTTYLFSFFYELIKLTKCTKWRRCQWILQMWTNTVLMRRRGNLLNDNLFQFQNSFWRFNLEIPFGDSTWHGVYNCAHYSQWRHGVQSNYSGICTAKCCTMSKINIWFIQWILIIKWICVCYHKKL